MDIEEQKKSGLNNARKRTCTYFRFPRSSPRADKDFIKKKLVDNGCVKEMDSAKSMPINLLVGNTNTHQSQQSPKYQKVEEKAPSL